MDRSRFNSKRRDAEKLAALAAENRELATMAEACKLFRVCDRTIIRRVKAGELPGVKQGGQWRFPWAKLRELAGVAG